MLARECVPLCEGECTYTHYSQRLSCAAVAEEAKIINRGARSLRQRATKMQGVPA